MDADCKFYLKPFENKFKRDSNKICNPIFKRFQYNNVYDDKIKHILKSMVNNKWNDVYSEICKHVPKDYRKFSLKGFVYFPNIHNEYIFRRLVLSGLDLKTLAFRNFYYVDDKNHLRKMIQEPRKRIRKYKRIQKKVKKSSEFIKYDYRFDITEFKKSKYNFSGTPIHIQTSETILEDGTVKPHKTYFTIKGFIDWAHRYEKTYYIKVKEYESWSSMNYKIKIFAKDAY